MQKSTRRLVLAVAIHPSTVKVCALYAFRLVRLLGRAAEQSPERLRWLARKVSEAWIEFSKETPR